MWRTQLFSAAVLALVVCAYPYRHGAEQELTWHLDRESPAHWIESQKKLTRERGPLRYLGRLHLAAGGLDLYEENSDVWWLIGAFGEPRRCPTGRAALPASDKMVQDLMDIVTAVDEDPSLLHLLGDDDEHALREWNAGIQRLAEKAYEPRD